MKNNQAEFIILGSGTSTGVPMLGREYSQEFLANPKNHRMRPSALIKAPEGNILIDCTPEMRIQLLRENIIDIDAVIITHSHADHIMGIDDLRCFVLKNHQPVPIYVGLEHQHIIKRAFKYAFEQPLLATMNELPYKLIDIDDEMEICGLNLEMMWVQHGEIRSTAVRVNDLAYITDVSSIPKDALNKLQNLDTLILDAARYKDPHPRHLTLDQAIDIIQELKPKKTYLSHLSDDYDHDKVNRELPENIFLAYDQLKIPIELSSPCKHA